MSFITSLPLVGETLQGVFLTFKGFSTTISLKPFARTKKSLLDKKLF